MAEFFEKLQDIINLEESLEGIRDIMLAIYRNGTISIKKISRITNITVPIVSKVVNILIERNILGRNDYEKGVQFWEHSMNFIEEYFQFYGYGVPKCPKCKGRPNFISPRFEKLFDFLNPIFDDRPSVNTVFDQSKNTVETAIQRVLYFYNEGALEGKNVVFLGDDDFTSVAVGALYKCFFPNEPHLLPKSVTVIDIDNRILNEIKEIYSELKLQIECINYNLIEPVPFDLKNKFDTAITDPPYSLDGLRLFLSRAISMMNINNKYMIGKELFLSYAHRSSKKTFEIQSIITEMGLSIMEIIPRFNKYEGSEVLGNQTQMFHIKTTSKTKPIQQPDEEFKEKIYTGETHPYIRKYKCKECGFIIEVGPEKEFVTIELLKGNKCPDCNESNKFELIDKYNILP